MLRAATAFGAEAELPFGFAWGIFFAVASGFGSHLMSLT